MIKGFSIGVLVLALISCGNQVKEAVGDSDIKDSVNRDTVVQSKDTSLVTDTLLSEVPVVIKSLPSSKQIDERLKFFRDQYLVNYNEVEGEENKIHVLDRFPSEKKFKIYLKKKFPVKYGNVDSIFPIANIRAYVYKDSSSCATAVNNWYNCFGNDCSVIKKSEDNMIKSTPGYYIINRTSIICLDYALEHMENNWSEMIKNMKLLFADDQSVLIRVKPHGKLNWEN